MFFDTWYDLLRMVVVGTISYAGLVVLLRVSGKRTLAKMNAFDLVVTIALGSTFASALLSSDVTVIEALSAFALLCALQYGVAVLSVRSKRFQNLIKSEPTLLFYRGAFLESAIRSQRVTKEEVYAAMRTAGAARTPDIDAVVLETDGSFSVVSGVAGKAEVEVDTLQNVTGRDLVG